MDITGKLHVKFETQVVSEKFKKREFVLEIADNPMYPQLVSFQLTQENCGLLDKVKEGSNIDVTFNLRGREWVSPQGEKKYFNTLEAWRLSVNETAAAPAAGNGEYKYPEPKLGDGDDDLPF